MKILNKIGIAILHVAPTHTDTQSQTHIHADIQDEVYKEINNTF